MTTTTQLRTRLGRGAQLGPVSVATLLWLLIWPTTSLGQAPEPAAAETLTLLPYIELRRALRASLDEVLADCGEKVSAAHPRAAGRVEAQLLVGPEGDVLTESWRTLGFVNTEPLPSDATTCVARGLAERGVSPPPKRRSVRLCVPFVLGTPKGGGVYRKAPTDDCERRFEIVPEVPDPKQLYLESLAATTWRNTPEIWRCFEQGPKERVLVKWALDRSGLVAKVEVLTALSPAVRSCIDRTIIRWVFPPLVAGVDRLVVHEFDPELSGVRR